VGSPLVGGAAGGAVVARRAAPVEMDGGSSIPGIVLAPGVVVGAKERVASPADHLPRPDPSPPARRTPAVPTDEHSSQVLRMSWNTARRTIWRRRLSQHPLLGAVSEEVESLLPLMEATA